MNLAKEKGWISKLPSQARLQRIDDVATLQGRQPDKFSEAAFHRCLLNFIITVRSSPSCSHVSYSLILISILKSLNVVECPEFRDLLLLLQNDLEIPHRTQLRELVIQAWGQYFQDLCEELVVCPLTFFDESSHCFYPGVSGANFIYNGHVV